jgi:outer membrane protein TolC
MKYLLHTLLLLLIANASFSQSKNLDGFLQQALTNSPLIKDLNNQILSAQIDSVRIRAGLKPQLTASSAGLYAPVVHGFGYSNAITNGQSFNGLLSVNKSFIGKGYLNSQFAGIGLMRDSLSNNVKLTEQDLKRSITGQYITAYGSLEQQKYSKEIVDLLSKEDNLLKSLTRSNVYRQSDYLSFLVTLKQAQLQLSQARRQYQTDFAMLNYLSGIADTTITEISMPELTAPIAVDVRNSIFFRQYKLDSLRLTNSRQLIDFSYKPKLSVFADAGYNSDLTAQYYKNFGTSVGFTVSLPLYDGGLRKLAYKQLSIEQETQRSNKAFFNKQYAQQISQLNQQISTYDKLIIEIREQFKYSESLIKVDTQLLQTGDLKIADLILALNNYLSIKSLLSQNIISRLQLINELNYWSR